MCMEIELFEIDKKIKQIENKDDCFEENPKWQELRHRQEVLFCRLADRKLKYHQQKYEETKDEKFIPLINRYKKYLEDSNIDYENETIWQGNKKRSLGTIFQSNELAWRTRCALQGQIELLWDKKNNKGEVELICKVFLIFWLENQI